MIYSIEGTFLHRTVHREGGVQIAEFDKAFWSERASAMIGGRPWSFDKDGGARTGTTPAEPGLRFVAWTTSMLGRSWQVQCGPTVYGIHSRGLFTTTYDVVCGGMRIGVSGRNGFLTNKPFVDVPPNMPVEHAVFLLWIAFLMRRRASASASSA